MNRKSILVICFLFNCSCLFSQVYKGVCIMPSRQDFSNYYQVVVGDIAALSDNNRGQIIQDVIINSIMKLKTMDVLDKHAIQSLAADFGTNNPVNEASVAALRAKVGEAFLVTGRIQEERFDQQLLRGETNIGINGCFNYNYYQLSMRLSVNFRFIDVQTGRLLHAVQHTYENVVKSEYAYCKDATPFNVDDYIRLACSHVAWEACREFSEYKESVEVALKDEFWKNPFPELDLVRKYLQQQKFDEALPILKGYTETSVKYKEKVRAKAFYNYGEVLLMTGKNQEGLEAFEEACRLNPKESDYFEARNRASRKINDDANIILRRMNIEDARNRALGKQQPAPNQNSRSADPTREPGQAPLVVDKNVKIWAVIVSVADYADVKVPALKYTINDAKIMSDFLKSPNGGNVPDSRIKFISGKQATRSNVIKAISETSKQAFDSDMIMFYFACHGLPNSDGSDVFLMPFDVEHDNLEGTAISFSEVTRLFNKSKASKKIMIADACHSGGMGIADGTRSSAESVVLTNKMLLQIAMSDPSSAYLSASSSNEKSQETEQLKHGVFTYYLVEGLKGAADKDNNGFITLREAYEYTYRKVSDYTKGKQHPELKGKFEDYLPLGIVK